MKNILILLLLYIPFTTYSNSVGADSLGYPRIGKPCPDFKLENVEYFPKSTVTLLDFKGKWLILDFWTEYCISCVESFPKLNAIQEEFKDDIQIILLGKPWRDPQKIQNLFETHRVQKNLNLPVVYESTLSDRFGVLANPFIVIVDPKGIVRYITSGFNRAHIAELLDKGTTTLKRSYTKFDVRAQDDYKRDIPLLIANNGGDELSYLFRSVLTEYNEFQKLSHSTIGNSHRLEMLGFDLTRMYKYAYGNFINSVYSTDTTKYAKIWPDLFFETADTVIFKGDLVLKRNLFSYSAHVTDRYLEVFGDKKLDLRQVLRDDLSACFPYIASIEKRIMPCNYLVIDKANLAKLSTNSNEYTFEWIGGKGAGFKARKMPIIQLRNQLSAALGYSKNIPLIYNGENILIDISIQSIYYEDRIKELNKLGFSIVRGEKEMDVIVIRDK